MSSKFQIVKAFITLFWMIVLGYVLIGSVTESPLRVSREAKRAFISIIPQGWGFFTRNPRESFNLAFQKKNDGEWKLLTFRNNSFKNWLGTKRDSRAFNVELAHLLSQIDPNTWKNCNKDSKDCFENSTFKTDTLINNSLIKLIQGDIFVVKRKPIPWAWSKSANKINMPAQVAKVYVSFE